MRDPLRKYEYERIGGLVGVRKDCTVTDVTYVVWADADGWDRWRAGELIQDALPELDPEQREFLISGATPAEFDAIFGVEEEG
jgi:hypothetical protein